MRRSRKSPIPGRCSRIWGSEVRVCLEADWTSERYARLLGEVEQLCREHPDVVVLEWHGEPPSLWQLVWVAELLHVLSSEGVVWDWASPTRNGLPSWMIDAGGLDVRSHGGYSPR